MKQKLRPLEVFADLLFFVCGLIAIVFVLFTGIYLVVPGLPAIREIGLVDFLFGTEWASTAAEPRFGMLPFILTSIYGTVGVITLGVPVGLMITVFPAKVAPPRLASLVRPAVDLLAGIPSVVYGLIGTMVLVSAVWVAFRLPDGASLFCAILVLAVMTLPSIISVSETALKTVPEEYEETSLALGATYIETVFRVSVPAASSSIAASIVLGIGRAIDEAMAVVMVAGNMANMPDLFQSVRSLTTAVSSEMAYASGLQRRALFSIALVLFLFTMLINIVLNTPLKRKKRWYTDMEMRPLSDRRRVYDRILRFLLYFCAALICALLLFIIGYIFLKGLPHVTWQFLSTQPSFIEDTIDILPNILNTVYFVGVTLIVALPLRVGTAIYLTEYARNRRLVAVIEFATEAPTGIPSIILGLVGMLFFCRLLGLQASLLASSLTLVIVTIPTIIRTTQESLRTIPQSFREAALGLGAGKWHMVRIVVLPSSVDGIVTGYILIIGRIMDESAALLFTAGMGMSLNSFLGSVGNFTHFSGASLTVALYMYARERAELNVAFAITAILMLLTLVINLSAKLVGRTLKKK